MNFSKKGTVNKQKQIRSTSKKSVIKAGICFLQIFLICLVVMASTATSGAVGIINALVNNAPSIDDINVAPTGFATTIYDRDGNETRKLVGSEANREYVSIDKIPEKVQDAFIAIEDERFWSHNGIDVKGIFRAFITGITKGGFSQGASTITQQLLKNSVFEGGNEDSFVKRFERKVQEQYLAIQLEDKLSKEEILEYYLNTINLGQNTLGVQAASKRYFNKEVSELTLSEATVIAGITKNPTGFNPIKFPEKNAERRLLVLGNMKNQGYITQDEYNDAIEDNIYERIQLVNEEFHENNSSVNSYFEDELITQVSNDLQEKLGVSATQAVNMIYRGGLSIVTTQSSDIQAIADKVIADPQNYPMKTELELTYQLSVEKKDGTKKNYTEGHLRNYIVPNESSFDLLFDKEEDATEYINAFRDSVVEEGDTITGENISFVVQPQVSFVLMDQYTGEVLAIVGGRGEKTGNRTLNRATTTKRQPGSTFKIISTYLPALDTAGMTLATVEDDAKYYYPGTNKEVLNWTKTGHKGLVTLRQAITNSMNVVTVKTLEKVTPQLGFDYSKKLGITTLVENRVNSNGGVESDINLSMGLGGITDGVTNLELTAAYATIANGGVYTEPTFYTKIIDHDGKVILDNKPKTNQVMKESTAWLLTNAMEDVVKIGTGTLTRFRTINMPMAGKTGTTNKDLDLWFSGYTPYYTATIWGGYDHNKDQTNTSYIKIIWRKIMEEIHQNLESKNFKKPNSIASANICTKSGKLAVDGVCNLSEGGSTVRTEYFAKGTVPNDKCSVHIKLNICTASNKLVNEFCPEKDKVEKVYLTKKETYTTADTPYILPDGLVSSLCDVHKTIEPTEPPEENENPEINKPITPVPTEPPTITTPPTVTPTIGPSEDEDEEPIVTKALNPF
jgi:penicillin-binding protein 1A